MPASQKQIDANRANAARSTGPRTPGGKGRSKMNAVSHGLTAQASVLPGEDASQLEELSESLMRQLRPRGVVQRLIAERVVSLAWKLRRVARAEEAIARQMEEGALRSWEHERAVNEATNGKLFADLGPRPRPRNGGTLLADSLGGPSGKNDGKLVRITQYELKLDAALRAAVKELRNVQKDESVEWEQEVEPEREAAPEPAPAQNEANGGSQAPADVVPQGDAEDPGLRCAAPAACGDAPMDKTNPIPRPDGRAEVVAFNGVAAESSAPAPGTSASPPPGPRP